MESIFNIIKIIVGSFFLFIYEWSNPCFIYNSIKYISLENYKNKLFERNHVKIQLKDKESIDKDHYSCVSFNIHNGFNFFNNYKIKEIIRYLHNLDADFICLQEVFDKEQFNYINECLGYTDRCYAGDLCIFSKYKIQKNVNTYYDNLGVYNHNNFLVSTIKIKDTVLYIINAHLMNDITFYKQKREIKEIMKYINSKLDKFKDKILIVGDFNYTKEFTDIYTNQFSYVNYVKSFPSIYPILSLDKVYFRNIKLNKNEIQDIYYSDHKPLYVEFTL